MLALKEKVMVMRQLWSVVEETEATVIINLSDTDLIDRLLNQLEHRNLLNKDQIANMSVYISSRIPLIRDLAQAR